MKRYALLARGAVLALLALGAGAACKDSSGPNNSVSFPALPSNLLEEFCHRGNALIGETKSGTLSSTDCDSRDSYYEIWRIRVASTTSVTFDLNSGFDNYLTVLRLESYSTSNASLSIIGENDDRSSSNLNAMVTVSLQPNTDYFVSISGYDYSETGPYTLQIR